ncbi:MAG: glutamate--tRNA ligase [Burkholderiaceae bacterium]|jgi:glutamyl-tRNA synthetase|nr:glutamate--tRNA ligase [Burkholderiaceae bacterium]
MSARRVRTRIAPSPTGFLHLGTARTALFSWAYARHFGGDFILRIEDTDVARSSQEAVDQIVAAMRWLELDYDEGPFFQMQRIERYREVIAQMLAAGTAYHCYCSTDELDAMREAQRARGEKPRYDGRWRPEPGKPLPAVPAGVPPVVRFRNPEAGVVSWNDLVKGPISISNRELDDLVIARADGTPTYNFCVVVDDWDMQISHVIRGDDHVNNTPRQINILRALIGPEGELPVYGHVPMILGPDGDKLSKRHGAVSVTQYEDDGYLPEAMLNYLARLGWSHGDTELFSREQLIAWFDGQHLARSPAQWDPAKLNWVNAHYLKQRSDASLADLVARQLARRGIDAAADERLARMCALYKDRCATTAELADWIGMYFVEVHASADDLAAHVTGEVRPAVVSLRGRLAEVAWDKASIAAAIKATLSEHGLKMPQLAHAVRVLVCGRSQTPSLDAVLELFTREQVLWRLRSA